MQNLYSVYHRIFHNQKSKVPECSSQGVNIKATIFLQMDRYSAIKVSTLDSMNHKGIMLSEKPVPKDKHIPFSSMYMAFWKRQNYRNRTNCCLLGIEVE
jgi:hypothetical protein